MPWDQPRDPARIEPTLEAIREYWSANPDLRLGQLVSNAARSAGVDTFFIEDARLVEELQADPTG